MSQEIRSKEDRSCTICSVAQKLLTVAVLASVVGHASSDPSMRTLAFTAALSGLGTLLSHLVVILWKKTG